MKKLLAVLLSAAMLGSAFAGCAPKTEPTPETPAPSPETPATDTPAPAGATELEMWSFIDLHGPFMEKMATSWNQKNPDRQVKINFTALPYEDMHNKLLIALQTGEGAPDICDIEISKFPNFLLGTPQLEPLNEAVAPYQAKVVQSRLDVYSKDGTMYGVPSHVGATVMYYNTEIMDAAGVDYTTIKTWDDYRAAGKIVLEKTGKNMGIAETKAAWTLSAMLAQQGSDLTSADGSQPTLNTPEAIKSATLIQDMVKDKTLVIAPGGQPDEEECKGFIGQGNVASVLMPLWYMSRFTDAMPDLAGKMAIAPVPTFEAGQPRSLGLGGTGTAVMKTGKDVQLAKDFLAYAKLSEEGTTILWETLGFDPVNKDLWKNKEVTHDPENIYVKYFKTNPFDTLNEVAEEIQLIKTVSISPAINVQLTTVTMNALLESMGDPTATMNEAQESVLNEIQ